MSQTAIHADLEAEFAAVAASSGCELVHVELKGGTLRVILDRPQGVTVDDCATVSRQLSALLDVSEFARAAIGDRQYLLEVSSPGLDRQLYRPRDYERFRGRLARLTFRTATAGDSGPPSTRGPGAKRTIVGRLEDFRRDTEGAEVSVLELATGERWRIPLEDIRKARLEVELS